MIERGSRQSAVRIVDPKTGRTVASFDAAPERAKKPQVQAIVCTPRFLAISRVDGTALLLHPKTRKLVARFDRHATQSYFGPPLGFSPDGTTLWVGACPKRKARPPVSRATTSPASDERARPSPARRMTGTTAVGVAVVDAALRSRLRSAPSLAGSAPLPSHRVVRTRERCGTSTSRSEPMYARRHGRSYQR